ncbi:MAG: hypothetical protein ABI680_19800, partial [Chthoniobacteraceae bacterium]
MMRSFILGMAGAVIVALALFLGAQWQRQKPNPWDQFPRVAVPSYEFHQQAAGFPYVFDKANGRLWRYYRNTNEKGEPTSEGMIGLTYANAAQP